VTLFVPCELATELRCDSTGTCTCTCT